MQTARDALIAEFGLGWTDALCSGSQRRPARVDWGRGRKWVAETLGEAANKAGLARRPAHGPACVPRDHPRTARPILRHSELRNGQRTRAELRGWGHGPLGAQCPGGTWAAVVTRRRRELATTMPHSVPSL